MKDKQQATTTDYFPGKDQLVTKFDPEDEGNEILSNVAHHRPSKTSLKT
jgi:hypothetical protein